MAVRAHDEGTNLPIGNFAAQHVRRSNPRSDGVRFDFISVTAQVRCYTPGFSGSLIFAWINACGVDTFALTDSKKHKHLDSPYGRRSAIKGYHDTIVR